MARKTEKGGKFRNDTVGRGIWQKKLIIMENEKPPIDDLKNDETTEKLEK